MLAWAASSCRQTGPETDQAAARNEAADCNRPFIRSGKAEPYNPPQQEDTRQSWSSMGRPQKRVDRRRGISGRFLLLCPSSSLESNEPALKERDLVTETRRIGATFRSRRQFPPIGITSRPVRSGASQEGYAMLIAVFLLALLTLSLSIAVPNIARQIQREREVESMHRGKQYTRAIQLYYRKFHKYPASVDALEGTDGIRFLRKRYVDPITGKSDWRPILYGQNKLPTVIGFFGQTLAGPISPTGSGDSGLMSAGASGTDQSAAASAGGNSATIGTLSGSNPPADQSFVGAMIGVTIPSEKRSILIYKGQQQYDKWELVYDPASERFSLAVGGSTGAGASPATGVIPAPAGPNGSVPGGPWGPNGNLPSSPQPPSGGTPIAPWGPNGNLPSPPGSNNQLGP
jgi:type II secretory pathway pseudopilin PulG